MPRQDLVSPEPVAHLSQHRLLPLLLQHARQLGKGGVAEVRFGCNVTDVKLLRDGTRSGTAGWQQQQQHTDTSTHPVCVTLTASSTCDDSNSSSSSSSNSSNSSSMQGKKQQQQQQLRCAYLVAADGANSTVRSLMGVQLEGESALQHLVSVHFTWPELGAALLNSGRAAMLYFIFNANLVGVVVGHDLAAGEFVAQVPFFPPLQRLEDFTPERCAALVTAAAGLTSDGGTTTSSSSSSSRFGGSGPQLRSVRSWVMGAEIAERYDCLDGRVLLAGDAAHRRAAYAHTPAPIYHV